MYSAIGDTFVDPSFVPDWKILYFTQERATTWQCFTYARYSATRTHAHTHTHTHRHNNNTCTDDDTYTDNEPHTTTNTPPRTRVHGRTHT